MSNESEDRQGGASKYLPKHGVSVLLPDARGEISEDSPLYSYILLENGNIEIVCFSTNTRIKVPQNELDHFVGIVGWIPGYLKVPISKPSPALPVICLDD